MIWGLRVLFIYLSDMIDCFGLNGDEFEVGRDYDGMEFHSSASIWVNGLIWIKFLTKWPLSCL